MRQKLIATYICMYLCFCYALFSANAQQSNGTAPITIDKTGTLLDMIQHLEDAYQLQFSYQSDLITSKEKISLRVKNATLQQTLDALSEAANLSYVITDSAILLRQQDKKKTKNEGFKVTGVVTDESGFGLPGVTLRVKHTGLGTATSTNGQFGIKMPVNKDTLIVTYIGMKTQTIGISGDMNNLKIVMKESTTHLDDLVVTGYNIEKQRTEITGSLTQLEQKDLESSRPMESFERLLEGKIAGVEVNYTGGGEAGLPVAIRIRGQSTFSEISNSYRHSSAEPLYIIDGVPLYDITVGENTSASANEQRLNPLSAINPYDIESITVLKDANASAIYGANAANGVILITTKKGKEGKLQVTANYTQGISNAINTVKLLNSEQYVMLYKETLMNDGLSDEEATKEAGSDSINTNWKDYLLQTAQYQSFNMSLSGGSKRISTRASFFYKKQETIAKGNDFMNFGGRTSSSIHFGEKLDANYNMALTLHRKNSLNYFTAYKSPPNISPYNADGSYNESGYFENLPNPVSALAQNENSHKGLSGNMNGSLSFKPWPELTISGLGGLDVYQNTHTIYRSGENATGRSTNGRLWVVNRNNLKWITNIKARWTKEINENQHLTLMAGAEAQKQVTDMMRGTGYDFMFTSLHTLTSATTRSSASSSETSTTLSYFGDLSYDIEMKYVFSATFRNDASSIFGGDVRNARFISGGFAWNLDQEAFLSGNPYVTNTKIRTSYGSTGNARIGTYAAKGTYKIDNTYSYDGNGGIIPFTGANDNLTWEKNLKFNIGTDFSLFKRFHFTIDYYQNNTKDAIAEVDSPFENGFQEVDLNVGHIRNSGWEWSMNTTAFKNDKIEWSINLNASKNKNIIKELLLSEGIISPTYGIGYTEGADTRTIYGMRSATVNPETGVRRWYRADGSITEDRNDVIDVDDLLEIGTLNPRVFGGMGNNLKIGNFSISVFTPFSFGSDIMIADKYLETNGYQIYLHNQSVNQLDRWQNPGDITYISRLSANSENLQGLTKQTTELYDNSYIKLQNVAINYQFSMSLIQKWGLSSLSVFVQATNIGYWYFGDQPKNRNGVAEYKYQFPEARTFSTGINLSF